MGHQTQCRWPLLHFFFHLPVERRDLRLQPVQRLQQALPPGSRRRATTPASPTPPVRLRSTACVCVALPGSAPARVTGSWCASAPALACDDAPATAACPAPPGSAPRSAGTALPATALADAPRPADRSSACALRWLGFWPHPPATTPCPTPPAAARTTDSARKLPSPRAPLAPPANGKIAP